MRSGDNKLVGVLILISILIVSLFPLVAAYDTQGSVGGLKTLVAGKIYYADNGEGVAKAQVIVRCYHLKNGIMKIATKKIKSLDDGTYSTYFVQGAQCDEGDEVHVEAYKNDVAGSNEGVVEDKVLGPLDVAVINVPLVPEFGVIAGTMTILGAVGTFFIIRKKARMSRKNSKKD